jgi:gas vesicle protein
MKKIFSFVSGALVGGLIGAILALLFAPMKGTLLQTKIQAYVLEVSTEARQAALAKKNELEMKLADLRK